MVIWGALAAIILAAVLTGAAFGLVIYGVMHAVLMLGA